jgi:hypothetical protein
LDPYRKARAVERLLFALLLVALASAGYCYERFRGEVPSWKLVGLIVAGICAAYAAYRFALHYALEKLGV